MQMRVASNHSSAQIIREAAWEERILARGRRRREGMFGNQPVHFQYGELMSR
jgi:hypothetical protein